jgi:hypothetical protein
MKKEVSIVLAREVKNYRKLAQQWYNLTDDQMVGTHVHHNPPRHQGGRNVPEHLYVYHNTLHSAVHDDEFILWAREGGRAGGKISGVDNGATNGKINATALNAHENTKKVRSTNGKANGKANAAAMNAHKNTLKQRRANGKANGAANISKIPRETLVENAGTMNSHPNTKTAQVANGKANGNQKWQCLITGHVSNAGGLTLWQRARGVDTSMRKRL